MRHADIFWKTLFWSAILYLLIVLWTITLGQRAPFEFQDFTTKNRVYDFIWWFTPLAILVTVFSTIKAKYSTSRNFIVSAVALSIIPIFLIYMFMIRFLDAEWQTTEIIYVHGSDSNHRIEMQYIDLGIASGRRTVEIEPFTQIFYRVKKVDSLPKNDSNWIQSSPQD